MAFFRPIDFSLNRPSANCLSANRLSAKVGVTGLSREWEHVQTSIVAISQRTIGMLPICQLHEIFEKKRKKFPILKGFFFKMNSYTTRLIWSKKEKDSNKKEKEGFGCGFKLIIMFKWIYYDLWWTFVSMI